MFSRLSARWFSSQQKYTRIKCIFEKKPLDEHLTVKGWVYSTRRLKKATFLDLNDGSSSQKLQVVLPDDMDVSQLSYHCAVCVAGTLKKSSHPKQEFELHADNLQVVGSMTGDTRYPFAVRQRHPPDYVRQFQHVRARTNTFAATLRLRAQARACITEHYAKAGFIHVDTPITTSNECEGGGNVFSLQTAEDKKNKDALFFGKETFLTVSGQMHLEALANGLSLVYTFNPAFRAEPSMGGRRHLAEFWMVEAEEAFLEGEPGLSVTMDRIEALVKDTINTMIDRCCDDLKLHWKQDPDREMLVRRAATEPFARLSYSEAKQRLSPPSSSTGSQGGSDLNKEDELRLTELLGGPVFVTHWPTDIKPFYMSQSSTNPNTVLCFDLLLPGVGEVAGGSVREQDPLLLQQRAPPSQNLDWYFQLRRWGAVPTAGYGLGFERLLLFLLGTRNIKDIVPFPRWPGHCEH